MMITWITGPPGAGKTTVGRLFASQTGREFLDLDEEIVETAGLPIADIIERYGEEEFRRIETTLLTRIARESQATEGLVVATGGGSVVSHHNRDLMRASGYRVYLEVDPETLTSRLAGDEPRPLLGSNPDLESIGQVLEKRSIPYDDHDARVDGCLEPEEICSNLSQLIDGAVGATWEGGSILGGRESALALFSSPWAAVVRLRDRIGERRTFVVTDENVNLYYGETIRSIAGPEGIVYVVEPGEGSKSIGTAENILNRMASEGFQRGDVLVAFGGGMVTDLGGFVGSVYMRGICTLSVPTSTLAMVDASVGGKTALNAGGIRNLVGTFSPPDEVAFVPTLLRTLPEREFRTGIVESLKMGFLSNRELVARACNLLDHDNRTISELSEVVSLSVEAKLKIIGEDLHDRGGRRALNFGHTAAHALEAVFPETWTHGEAVALGMMIETEAALSDAPSLVDGRRADQMVSELLPFTPQAPLPVIDPMDFIDRAMLDKKGEPGEIRAVLPVGEDGWDLEGVLDKAHLCEAIETVWERVREYHESTFSGEEE